MSVNIHFQSDFKLFETPDKSAPYTFQAPFRFAYYTNGATAFVATHCNGEYTNCELLEDGRLMVTFDNHDLGPGRVTCRREFFLTDEDYADGVCDLVIDDRTDIFLTMNGRDLGDINIELPPFYQKGDKGDNLTYDSLTPEEKAEVFTNVTSGVVAELLDSENITYEDFCGKMTNGELRAGRLYRITDYVTVVGGLDDVTSAGHPFDLIVLATGPSAYSEECWAAHSEREGCRYFENCDLSRWKVWWRAIPESGEYEWVSNAPDHKGVIYRLIDENNNDLPYDFKNILVNGEYTLSLKTYDGFSDASVRTDADKMYRAYDITPMDNITMRGRYAAWEGFWRFPYNIVRNYDALGISDGCYYGYTCRNIFMDYGCNNNVIEDGENIHLGKCCEGNSILGSNGYGGFAYNITLGDQCFGNKIGTGGDGSGGDICDITIGDNCAGNTIEDWVYNITMTNSGSNTIASESDTVELYSAGNCYVGAGSNNCIVRNCGTVMTPGWVSGVTYQNMNDQNLDTDTRIIGNCYVTQDSNGNVVVKSPDDKGVYYLDIDRKDLIDLKTFDIEVQYTPYAALKDAVSRGQVVILPYDKGNHAIGGYVANVTVDDFVYVTVQTEESAYTLEGIIYKDSDQVEFLGSSLQYKDLSKTASVTDEGYVNVKGAIRETEAGEVFALPSADEKTKNDADQILATEEYVSDSIRDAKRNMAQTTEEGYVKTVGGIWEDTNAQIFAFPCADEEIKDNADEIIATENYVTRVVGEGLGAIAAELENIREEVATTEQLEQLNETVSNNYDEFVETKDLLSPITINFDFADVINNPSGIEIPDVEYTSLIFGIIDRKQMFAKYNGKQIPIVAYSEETNPVNLHIHAMYGDTNVLYATVGNSRIMKGGITPVGGGDGGEGGASVHYLDFDVADLESLLAEYEEWETPPYFEGDYYSLKEAVEKGQIIVMPKDKNNHSLGGYVASTTVSIANGMGVVEFSMQVGKFIYFLRAGGIDLEDDNYYVVNAPAAHRRSLDELVTDNDVNEALGSLDDKYAKLFRNTGYVQTSGCLYEDVGGYLFLLPTEDTDDMRDFVDYVLATEEYVDQKLGDVNAVLENIING